MDSDLQDACNFLGDAKVSNGAKTAFVRRQIATAVNDVTATKGAEGTCTSHAAMVTVGITSLSVDLMLVEGYACMDKKLDKLLERRKLSNRLLKLVAAVFGTGGVVGAVALILQLT